MEELFIPTLHTFAMKNTFTGSYGMLRFRITPEVVMLTPKEVDFANSSMKVEYWHGIFCYEKSQIQGAEVFPLTEAGRASMKAWLEDKV